MMEATADGPEIHLRGGGFDNAGFGSTGWGIPTMGRGAQHGWLLVSGSSEAGTVFAEKLNPKNRYEYWYKGAWKRMEHRTETFKVKDRSEEHTSELQSLMRTSYAVFCLKQKKKKAKQK